MGKSGAARVKAGDAAYASAMQDHEDRLDLAGTRRRVREVPPLVYSPYASMDAPNPFDESRKERVVDPNTRILRIKSIIEEKPVSRNFSIMDACAAHVTGAKISKAATKQLLHGFMQLPTDIKITDNNQRIMLATAVDFIDETYGGNAVFHARIDRDEKGQHGVDVFFAPRYEKHTKSKGTEQWISLSKFSKDNARTRYGLRQKTTKNKKTGEFDPVFDDDGERVLVWNDADVFQGRALQDAWFEHLRDNVGTKFEVERGKRKKGRDPDRLSPEDYAVQQEEEKLRVELERQLAAAPSNDAVESSYKDHVTDLVAAARGQALRVAKAEAEAAVAREWDGAETDAKAITTAMLSDDGREFAELKAEVPKLQQTILAQGALIKLFKSALTRFLPNELLKRVESYIENTWKKNPQNPNRRPKPQPSNLTPDV